MLNTLHSLITRSILLVSILLVSLPAAAFDLGFLPVEKAFRVQLQAVDGQIKAHWDIVPGYYLYQEKMGLEAAKADMTLAPAVFATPGVMKDDPNFGVQPVYFDSAIMSADIVAAAGGSVPIKVSFQGCAEAGLCYPPQEQLLYLDVPQQQDKKPSTATAATEPAKPITTSSSATSADDIIGILQGANWPIVLLIFFALGIGLAFTPCVLPMIPILSGIIMGQRKPLSSSRAFILSLSYVLGMAITYTLAGLAVGHFGARANLQAWMQQPLILAAIAMLFGLLSLSMFGLYELQLPAALRNRLELLNRRQTGGHTSGVMLMGALSALVVSPCVSAPLAGTLIYISSTGDALLGGGALFALAMGMGAPLLVIGTFGNRFLPQTGEWMVALKQAFGVVMLAVALWLIERLVPQVLALALWALLFIALGLHLGAFHPRNQSGWGRSFQALGLVVLLWGVFLLWGAAQGGGSLAQPVVANAPHRAEATLTESVFERITTTDELNRALTSGEPVMLDFYADWCASCIVMEKEVFSRPEALEFKQQFRFVQLDVTDFNEQHQALLDQFQLIGPPAVIFFDKNGDEIQAGRIVSEVDLNEFLTRAERALADKPDSL